MHLTENEIVFYLEGGYSASEAERIENHLADCPDCCTALAEINYLSVNYQKVSDEALNPELINKAKQLVEPSLDKEKSTKLFRNAYFKYAFSIVVIIAVSVISYFIFTKKVPNSVYRSAEESKNISTISPQNNALLAIDELKFSWHPVPKSISYKFILYNENGTTLWQSYLQDTLINVPPSVILAKGNTYLWIVETILPNELVERSELNVFKLKD